MVPESILPSPDFEKTHFIMEKMRFAKGATTHSACRGYSAKQYTLVGTLSYLYVHIRGAYYTHKIALRNDKMCLHFFALFGETGRMSIPIVVFEPCRVTCTKIRQIFAYFFDIGSSFVEKFPRALFYQFNYLGVSL